MATVTLPLESKMVLHEDGTFETVHETYVTGEIGQAYVEAMLALRGCSVDDLVKFIADEDKKAAEERKTGLREEEELE